MAYERVSRCWCEDRCEGQAALPKDEFCAAWTALQRLSRFAGRYGAKASGEENRQALEDLSLLSRSIGGSGPGTLAGDDDL